MSAIVFRFYHWRFCISFSSVTTRSIAPPYSILLTTYQTKIVAYLRVACPRVCVWVCVCMCPCGCVRACIHVRAFAGVRAYVCLCVWERACTCARVCARMHVCVCMLKHYIYNIIQLCLQGHMNTRFYEVHVWTRSNKLLFVIVDASRSTWLHHLQQSSWRSNSFLQKEWSVPYESIVSFHEYV